MAFCNNVRSPLRDCQVPTMMNIWPAPDTCRHCRHIAYITIQRRAEGLDTASPQSGAGPWLGWYDSFSMIGFHFLPLLVLNGIEESDVGLCMGVMCHLMCWYREETQTDTQCTYYLYCPFLLLTNFTVPACILFTQNVSATLLLYLQFTISFSLCYHRGGQINVNTTGNSVNWFGLLS